MSFYYHFTIKGNPAIKKNGRMVVHNKRTGRSFPIKSKKLQGAETNAYADLMEQKRRDMKLPIRTQVNVRFVFYRATRHIADLSNLYELPQDALQKAGILENDSLIESHDGSRKRYDPENPRTEITITPYVEDVDVYADDAPKLGGEWPKNKDGTPMTHIQICDAVSEQLQNEIDKMLLTP